MIMPAFEHLAGALRLLRDRRSLTQHQVAQAIESPVKQISAYETGRQRPRIETLDRILTAVGADAMDLAETMSALESGELQAPPGGAASRGRPRSRPAIPSPEPAGELSPELRELAPRLPEIEKLANDVLVELLSEAVERQARRLSSDLRTGRAVMELPRGEE
jgi:transcriptional regulator with XRE-family HTH domain